MNLVELVLVIGLLFTSVVGQNKSEKKTVVVETLLLRFETANSTEKSSTPETNDETECNCTPFNLCKSYVAAEDGSNLINVRNNMAPSCQSYMDVCCDDKKTITDVNTDMDKKLDSGFKDNSVEKHDSDKKHELAKEHSSDKKNDSDKKHDSDKRNDSDKKYDSETKDDSDKKNDLDGKVDNDKTSSNCDCIGGYNEPYTEIPNDINENKPIHSGGHNVTKSPHGENLIKNKHPTPEKNTTEILHANKEPECGYWNKDGVGFRIINGIDGESQFGEYPSMVAIFLEEKLKEQKPFVHCGGTLIKKNVVLTAAHCVIKKNVTNLVVRAGEWDLKTDKEVYAHQDRRVVEVVTHPDYYAGALYNDVALIFTEESFSLQENVQTICLPKQNEQFVDSRCFTCGWGKTVSYNNYTIHKKNKIDEVGKYEVSILKKVEVPVVSREKCTTALRRTRLGPRFVLHTSFLCAGGEEGKDMCKGDGGGPLMCPSKDDPNSLVQVGIIAWGIQCGLADVPAVYVDVASFRNWIEEKIEYYNNSSLPKVTN